MKPTLTGSTKGLFLASTFAVVAACSNTGDTNVMVKKTPHASMVEGQTAQQPKQTQEMPQAALLKLMNTHLSGYTLLDVRSPEEFAEGHIAGAVNISHHQILQNIAVLDKYKDTHLIVYCRSGRRAGLVTDLLERQSGMKHVYHLTGDMLGWHKSGLQVVK